MAQFSLRKAFGAEPKPGTVVNQQFDGDAAFIAKNKHGAIIG